MGEQEGFYAELNDCDLRERVREAEFEYGYCESWDCRTYTRTCHVDGGPHFPGYTEAKAPCPEPDGKPFPNEDVVRAFMETVTPREPVLERDEPPKAVKEHDGVKGEVP